MIERKFVAQKIKEFTIRKFISEEINRAGLSSIKLKRTPLGDKIVIKSLKPGLVVGRAGSTINLLTKKLKDKFELNNPQIELEEIENPYSDPNVVAEQIVNSLERFGTKRFKGVGHKVISDVMHSGALGVEVLISGKVPSSRSKTWRFYQGYLKKCGDISVSGVLKTQSIAKLKSGIVGVQVSILPKNIHLPDQIKISDSIVEVVEEVKDEEELSDAQKELMKNIKSQEKTSTDKKDDNKTDDESEAKKKKNTKAKKSKTKTKKKSKKTDSENKEKIDEKDKKSDSDKSEKK
jgi:small subunit ribosomal protein S3